MFGGVSGIEFEVVLPVSLDLLGKCMPFRISRI